MIESSGSAMLVGIFERKAFRDIDRRTVVSDIRHYRKSLFTRTAVTQDDADTYPRSDCLQQTTKIEATEGRQSALTSLKRSTFTIWYLRSLLVLANGRQRDPV